MLYDISPSDFAYHVRQATSYQDLAKRCGCPIYTDGLVQRHRMRPIYQQIEKMKLNCDHFHSKCEVSDDVFIQIVKDSIYLTQVMKKCNTDKQNYNSNLHYYKSRIEKIGINIDHFKIIRKYTKNQPSKKMNAIDDETFQTILHNSRNWTDFMRNCGYTRNGMRGNVKKIILNRINRLGLNTEHFESKMKEDDKIFCKDSRFTYTDNIKKRLIKNFGWRYECNECKNVHFVEQDGVLTWMNKPVVLQLDHINGVNDDHRLENLQLLCALCHSQTSTFCGSNGKKNKAKQAWLEGGKTQVMT